MQVEMEQLAELPLFRLSGEMDHGSTPLVYETLDEHLPETISTGVLLDMADVPYVDSAGLGALSRLVSRCSETGWIGIISPSRGVFRLLEISGITTRQSLVILKDREADSAYAEELSHPRPKRERPRVSRLVEGDEEDWADEEGGESGENGDDEPLWGEEGENPPWGGRSREAGW